MELKEKAKILDKEAIAKALARIAHEIRENCVSMDDVVIVGIKNRGAYIGTRLAEKLEQIAGIKVPVGASTSRSTATT